MPGRGAASNHPQETREAGHRRPGRRGQKPASRCSRRPSASVRLTRLVPAKGRAWEIASRHFLICGSCQVQAGFPSVQIRHGCRILSVGQFFHAPCRPALIIRQTTTANSGGRALVELVCPRCWPDRLQGKYDTNVVFGAGRFQLFVLLTVPSLRLTTAASSIDWRLVEHFSMQL